MYTKIASPQYPKLKAFLSFAINYFKEKLHGKFPTTVNEYWGGSQERYERVGYIQLKDAVCYILL